MLHNRYRLTGQLGSGAFGTVLKAEDALLANRPVAIKRMDSATSNAQEMAFLATLDHPNIPPVQDFFEDHNCSYLVMKYISGQTLADRMAAGQALPADEVVRIGLTLCDVLTYLHEQTPPIIFRDLKPENVIVTPGGHLYLIDFGIARTFKPGQGKDTYALGSDGYAPPEQYDRTQTDPRSDIYALGALLYYLATADDPSEHVFRFSCGQIGHTGLRAVIERATKLDASNRQGSARTMAQDLRQCSAATASVPTSVVQVSQSVPMAASSPTKVLPGSATRTILWIYAPEDEKMAKELEVHLALVRRQFGITFLHNLKECVPGGHIDQYWHKVASTSFIVGVFHSFNFWGDDTLSKLWEERIYPTAKSSGACVLPIIARKGGNPREMFKEVVLPRNGVALKDGKDEDYASVAAEIRRACERRFDKIA